MKKNVRLDIAGISVAEKQVKQNLQWSNELWRFGVKEEEEGAYLCLGEIEPEISKRYPLKPHMSQGLNSKGCSRDFVEYDLQVVFEFVPCEKERAQPG